MQHVAGFELPTPLIKTWRDSIKQSIIASGARLDKKTALKTAMAKTDKELMSIRRTQALHEQLERSNAQIASFVYLTSTQIYSITRVCLKTESFAHPTCISLLCHACHEGWSRSCLLLNLQANPRPGRIPMTVESICGLQSFYPSWACWWTGGHNLI